MLVLVVVHRWCVRWSRGGTSPRRDLSEVIDESDPFFKVLLQDACAFVSCCFLAQREAGIKRIEHVKRIKPFHVEVGTDVWNSDLALIFKVE